MSEQNTPHTDVPTRSFWIREATEQDSSVINGYVVRGENNPQEALRSIAGVLIAESTFILDGRERSGSLYGIQEIGAIVLHASSASADAYDQIRETGEAPHLNDAPPANQTVTIVIPAELAQGALQLLTEESGDNTVPADPPTSHRPISASWV